MPKKPHNWNELSLEERKELKGLLKEESKESAPKEKETINDLGLFTFLETENERQDRLFQFFEKKLSLITDYPQGTKLIEQQVSLNHDLRKGIRHVIQKKDSRFQESMELIFQSYFHEKDSE